MASDPSTPPRRKPMTASDLLSNLLLLAALPFLKLLLWLHRRQLPRLPLPLWHRLTSYVRKVE